MRNHAGERPLRYFNAMSHHCSAGYQELVEQNRRGQVEEGDGLEKPEEEEACQEPPTSTIVGQGRHQERVEERRMDEEADAEPYHASNEPPTWQDEGREPQQAACVEEVLWMIAQVHEDTTKEGSTWLVFRETPIGS